VAAGQGERRAAQGAGVDRKTAGRYIAEAIEAGCYPAVSAKSSAMRSYSRLARAVTTLCGSHVLIPYRK
jgi:hypothetical protein